MTLQICQLKMTFSLSIDKLQTVSTVMGQPVQWLTLCMHMSHGHPLHLSVEQRHVVDLPRTDRGGPQLRTLNTQRLQKFFVYLYDFGIM